MLHRGRRGVDHDLHLSADQIGERRRRAAIGHLHHLDPGHHLEQLGGDVLRRADAGRGITDLAGIGFDIGDQLGNRLHRNRRIDLHHQRHAHDAGDRGDVADEIEIEILVQRGVDGIRRGHREQRVAVGRRAHHRLGADIAAGARLVFDDEGLAEPLGEPLAHQPHDDVLRAAGGKADDQVHRPRRIVERKGATGKSRRGRGGGGELQELAAAKCHGVAPRGIIVVIAGTTLSLAGLVWPRQAGLTAA